MDFIKQVLSGEAGAVAQVLSIVVIVNVCLTAIRSVLDAIKDKTKSDVDNKIASWLSVGLGWVSTLIDWLSANKEHKEKEEPKE